MIDLALFRDVLASEWTKLRSVRSTYWAILIAILLGIGIGAGVSAASGSSYDQMDLHDRLLFDPAAISLAGLFFAQLALGVFAIVTVSAEYSTGTIRATMAAVPQRGYVLAAKAVLVAAISLVVGIGVAFAAFALGQAIFATYGLSVPMSHPGVVRAIFGGGLYIGALTLLALGLAAIVRHTAGAITTLVGIVFILPIVTQLLPDSLQHSFARYLPAQAGGAVTSVIHTSTSLSPWAGYGVFLGWTALSLGVGWFLLRARDV